MVGSPATTYGRRSASHCFKRSFHGDTLYQAACIDAPMFAVLCNEEKPLPSKTAAVRG